MSEQDIKKRDEDKERKVTVDAVTELPNLEIVGPPGPKKKG